MNLTGFENVKPGRLFLFAVLIFGVQLVSGCQHTSQEKISINEGNKAFIAAGEMHKNLYVADFEFPASVGLNYLSGPRDEDVLEQVMRSGLDVFLYAGSANSRYQLKVKFVELTYDPPPRNASISFWVSPRLSWVSSSSGYAVAEFIVIDTKTDEQIASATSKRKAVFNAGRAVPEIMGARALEKSVAKSIVDLTTFLKELELRLDAERNTKISA